MDQYSFGGSRRLRIRSRIIASFVWSGCGISRFFVWMARRVNGISIQLSHRVKRLKEQAEPTTIHINKVVPLDKWTMRIEFTVDRKERRCMHLQSMTPTYAETFASYKRGEEVGINDRHYYSVAGMQSEWKKM
jgi:hypothetical protein